MHRDSKQALWAIGIVATLVLASCVNNAVSDWRKERDAADAKLLTAALERQAATKRTAEEAAKSPEQRASEAAALRAKEEADRAAALALQLRQAEAELAAAKRFEARQKLMPAIEKMKWWEACIAWGREKRSAPESLRQEALRNHLDSQNLLRAEDLSGANQKRAKIGMSTCGVYAALGRPDDVNRTQSSRSDSHQIIYRDRGVYVYTTNEPDNGNGVVRSIQD